MVFEGGFGPHIYVDIASRSLQPRRARGIDEILGLPPDARRLAAGARQSAHELRLARLKYQCRVLGEFGAQKCVRQRQRALIILIFICNGANF